ncbi:MAG: phosphoenolpyruvate carboxykinase [Chloroflexi bacterium]|nr:phosphoenolpyruvate carboxykinase [Chloroflexota bacterium]
MINNPTTKSTLSNPTQSVFHSLMASSANARLTKHGNLSIKTHITARSSEATFFVSDSEIGKPHIPVAEYQKITGIQDAYIAQQDMLQIDGYIGPEFRFRVACRLLVERSHANIAAMQQQLYFPPDKDFQPQFTVIITPDLPAQGYPGQRLIAVDLEHYTTRVLGSDYFGESKKGGLRMWNHWIYRQGGLALHAGCKVFPDLVSGEELALIIGLSGTGKTTTTFRQQRSSLPVQDDFCALFPDGKVYASENGCFAKTFGLDAHDEPTIYRALTQPNSWLENVSVQEDGNVDFMDGGYTTNGRGTFQLDAIPHREPSDLPRVKYIFLLNRNFNIIPAVARLNPQQASLYFMLGETTGTSAGGKAEAGKALRVPGTNPFFTMDDALQANRFHELINNIPDLEVYLLNTGRVGGHEDDARSKKVKIKHSSAIIEAILDHTIHWKKDPLFGYEIAAVLPGFEDEELLDPFELYKHQGRKEEYEHIARRLIQERERYLENFSALSNELNPKNRTQNKNTSRIK